ncbi:MAG: polysaccharide deacetylase family protein [Burkholderiales bacterium]
MNDSNNPWPPGQRCGVLVTVNFDAESVDLRHVEPENLCGRFSYGRYGMRAGLARVLALLREQALAATFFVPALDAENNASQVEAILRDGHEVAARGYAYEDYSQLGAAEPETLTRAHAALTRIAGRPPRGWRAPGGLLSPGTLPHLGALGYRYDSSFQDDDYPYVMRCPAGQELVELPVFQALDDATLYGLHHTQARLLKTWTEEFDAMYAAGTLVTLTLHVRGDYGSGRASRVAAVREFLDHVRAKPGVFFMTCEAMADWWAAQHPHTEPAPV